MARLLIILLVTLANPAFAIVNPNTLYIGACGRDIQVPPGISTGSVAENSVIMLGGYTGTAGNYATMRRSDQNYGYKVNTGKKLKVFAICSPVPNNTANVAFTVYANTTTDAGFDNATPPTGLSTFKGLFGYDTVYPMYSGFLPYVYAHSGINIEVTAGNGLTSRTNTNGTWVYVWAYETSP